MTANYQKVEKEARALSPKEKAALARTLIEELDPDIDENVERLWIEEAERRYQAYLAGEMETVPGEEAMQRARQRLNFRFSQDDTTKINPSPLCCPAF